MYLEIIENLIIEKLKATHQDFQVESFPSKFEEFSFTHPLGAILLRYQGSSFSDSQAIGILIQDEKIEFALVIGLRYLSCSQEAYPFLGSIKEALTGFKPQGCSKMQPVKAEFVDEENGDLWYGMTFSLTLTAFEKAQLENLPLLKKITLENNFGDTEVYPSEI